MLKELILGAQRERESLQRLIPIAREEVELAQRRVRRAQGWLLGWLLKRKLPTYLAALEKKNGELSSLEERLEGAFIDADIDLDAATMAAYGKLTEAFRDLAGCTAIWDITSSRSNDRVKTRSAAHQSVERRPVRFGILSGGEGVLQTEADGLRLQNANGADLVLFPGFILMQSGPSLALIDIREVEVEFSVAEFIESERVPHDAYVIGQVWAKSNRDGSPDRRFKDNYQIPLARYGRLRLASDKGLNEEYMLSNAGRTEAFVGALSTYQEVLEAFSSSSQVHDRSEAQT